MERSLTITEEPIDEAGLTASRRMGADQGAVVVFSGVVRDAEGADRIEAIDYEAFESMAVHQFHKLMDGVEARWPVSGLRLVHRIGRVAVNEPSLWVEVIAPHRAEAFAACQWLIDEMKRVVPIWKRPVRPREAS